MLLNQGSRLGYGPSYFRGIGSSIANSIGYQVGRSINDGARRSFYGGEHTVAGQTSKASIPSGNRHPIAWTMAPKPGGMASHKAAEITLSQDALAVLGLPASGSAEIAFTTTATGGLIVSGSGSASITFDAQGTILSVAAGSGSAIVTLSGSALIGALAGISGQSTVTLTPTAVIAAIGYLSGLSTNEAEFSPDALARAVWEALAADFNTAGSMGAKLNSASAAGDPWTAELPGTYATGQAGDVVGAKLLTLAKFLGLE